MERRSKYFAKPVQRHGLKFGSGVEAQHWQELLLRQQGGAIKNLTHHPRFCLLPGFRDRDGVWQRPINYEADASYVEDDQLVVIDVKALDRRSGRPRITGEAALKIKLWKSQHPYIIFKIVAR